MEWATISSSKEHIENDGHPIEIDRTVSRDTCLTRISSVNDEEKGISNDENIKNLSSSSSSSDISYRADGDATTSVHNPTDTKPVENSINHEPDADVSAPAASAASSILSPRNTIFMLILLSSTNLCLAMSASLVAPYFPREVLLKGGNVAMVGLVLSSYDAVRFVLAPFIGMYVNWIGVRFLLIAGPFIAANCTILFGLLGRAPPNTWFFILAAATRMMSGLGAIMYGVTTISIQPILFSSHFGFAFSILRSVSITGAIVGPAIGGLLYTAGGYPLPFYIIGVASLTAALVQAIVTPNLSRVGEISQQVIEGLGGNQNPHAMTADQQQQTTKQATLLKLFTNRHMTFCFFINITIGFVVMFYNSTISLHILPLVGSVSRVGYVMLVTGLSDVISAPFVGWLLDKFVAPECSTVIYFCLSTTGLLLIGPSPVLPFLHKSLPLVICGMICMGVGTAFGYPSLYKLAHKRAFEAGYPNSPHTYSVLTGCILTCTTFGGFLGPLIGGLLQTAVGFSWAYTIVAGFLLFMSAATICANFLIH